MATASTAFAPQMYRCSFPGCPVPVSIHISLIETLQEIAHSGDQDRQGILYGQPSEVGTVVENSQAVTAFELDQMGTAMAAAYDTVAGYYRIREGNTLELTLDEVDVAESLFTRPGCVVLLVERRAGYPIANFFFLQHGRVMNHPLLEFPLDLAMLSEREAHRVRRIDDAVAVPYAPEPPQAISEASLLVAKGTSGSPRRLPAQWWMVAIVVIVAVASFSAARFLNRPATRVDNLAGAAPSPVPPARSSLRAERQGEDLKIMWDLNSPTVADATSGVLDIDDGGTPRQILMTADQVRFGSVLYSPQSEQISARLTTLKDNQTTGQESVLVLLSRPPQPPPGSRERRPQIPFEVKAQRPAPARALIPTAGNREVKPPVERNDPPATQPAPERVDPPATQTLASAPPPAVVALRNEPANPITQPTPERVDPPASPAKSQSSPPVTTVPRTEPPKPTAQASPERVDPPAVTRSASPPPATTIPRPEPFKPREEAYIAPVLISQEGVRTPRELAPILIKPVAVSVRVEVNEAGRVTRAEAIGEKGNPRDVAQRRSRRGAEVPFSAGQARKIAGPEHRDPGVSHRPAEELVS